MTSIGIRVSPSKIFYSIAKETDDTIEVVTNAYIIVPKSLTIPDQLTFIRNTLISIILEYSAVRAGIRLTEGNSQNLDIFRVNTEGVIQELLANSTVERYFCGRIASIAKLIGEKSSVISEYFKGTKIYSEIEGWEAMKQEQREALLVAIAALSLGK